MPTASRLSLPWQPPQITFLQAEAGPHLPSKSRRTSPAHDPGKGPGVYGRTKCSESRYTIRSASARPAAEKVRGAERHSPIATALTSKDGYFRERTNQGYVEDKCCLFEALAESQQEHWTL